MLLTHTAATGYSLGMALWWSNNPEQLSTGWLQSLTITLKDKYRDVYLTRYARSNDNVSVVFSTAEGILCSFSGDLPRTSKILPLNGESDIFLGGALSVTPIAGEMDINLEGTRVNPRYIHVSTPPIVVAGNSPTTTSQRSTGSRLKIITDTLGHELSIDLTRLIVGSTSSIRAVRNIDVSSTVKLDTNYALTNVETTISGTGILLDYIESPTVVAATRQVQSPIYSINGTPVSADGSFTLELNTPNGLWAVYLNGGSQGCVVYNLATQSSCATRGYLSERLDPDNYGADAPLNLAFDTTDGEHIFAINNVYEHRFNTEYEDGGLAWNEFSRKHDWLGPDEAGEEGETVRVIELTINWVKDHNGNQLPVPDPSFYKIPVPESTPNTLTELDAIAFTFIDNLMNTVYPVDTYGGTKWCFGIIFPSL